EFDIYSISALELFGLFPDARAQFRVSTAARMNASFPFLSPAVDLPTHPPRRAVDAGYYDNYGVNLGASWLYAHRESIVRYASGVVVVQTRDSASHDARRALKLTAEQSSGLLGSAAPWLTGPLTGAGSAREAVTSFRNDAQLQILSEYFAEAAEA